MIDAETVAPVGEEPKGLTSTEARQLLERVGLNELVPVAKRTSALAFTLRLAADPMVLLLLGAAAAYFWLGDRFDAIVMMIALVPIFLVNAILEQRADAALERLRLLASPDATVMRDGAVQRLKATRIVPGDVLVLDEGDIVAADGFVTTGTRLSIDESALTGESIPVEKTEHLTADGRRVLAGTKVLAGHGLAIVDRTGPATEYGRIGGLLAQATPSTTPIQHAIRQIVVQLSIVVLAICVVVFFARVAHGVGWPLAIIAAISLAMAAIPEELPMVYTLYMALGAWRLAKNNALVRRLASVETLGTTQIICVDKTGTLTFGRLDLQETIEFDGRSEADVILAAVIASPSRLVDPLDIAIAKKAKQLAVTRPRFEVVRDLPFDPQRMYAATVWHDGDTFRVAVKGALEAVLPLTAALGLERERVIAEHDARTARGMRAIAVAEGRFHEPGDADHPERWQLTSIGLLAFADPVRPSIGVRLEECRRAGIEVIMITGDHASTARAVAREVGFGDDADRVMSEDVLRTLSDEALADAVRTVRVFARIRPEQKLRIVKALRANGSVIAMTGDGTNDALALREADIGIAMGERGTEVARSAADLVLLDDDFGTIVDAVRDGRRIFDNLKRAFRYLVAFHAPLLISAVVLPLAGAPLLLFPIHLVFLEIIVHPTSSLVFESDPGSTDLMSHPPRDARAALLDRNDWVHALTLGGTLAIAVVALFLTLLSRHVPVETARSSAIVAMITGQMFLVLVEDARERPFWRVIWTRTLRSILAFSVLSTFAIVYLTPLAHAMALAPLTLRDLGIAVLVGTCSALVFEPRKAWRKRQRSAA
jgi:Ca2+-transporting ATPase